MTPPTLLATLAALFLTTATVVAQPLFEVKKIAGDIAFYSTNHGLYGYNVADSAPGFSYPAGNAAIPYLNGGGLWFAARKRSADSLEKLAFVTFDPATHRSWAAPGGWSTLPAPAGDSLLNRIYDNREYHRGTGRYIGTQSSVPAWPLWGQKESYTGPPARPGRFITDTARRTTNSSGAPVLASDAIQLVTRYHDGVPGLYDRSEPGHPIGLQIEQNLYSQMQIGNFIIVQYRVINVSGDTLWDCYVGAMLDPEIGAVAENDHVGFLADHGIGYAWSDAESPDNPGILGLYLLEGPYIHADSRNSLYRFIAGRNRYYNDTTFLTELGLNSFRNGTSDLVSQGSQQRYDYMEPERFDNDPTAGDRTMMMTAGPFHMRPRDTAIIVVAVAVLPELDPASPMLEYELTGSRSAIGLLYQYGYIDAVRNAETLPRDISSIRIHPNPASNATVLALHLPHRDSPRIQLVDPLGRVMFEQSTGVLEAGDHVLNLDLAGVAAGMYLVTLESNGIRQSRTLVVSR